MQYPSSALTGKKRRNWLNMVILTVSGDVFPLMGAENEYNWTEPYMISRQVVAVNRSSDIYRLSDLEGKTIARAVHH